MEFIFTLCAVYVGRNRFTISSKDERYVTYSVLGG
jgi:hypothetical protein